MATADPGTSAAVPDDATAAERSVDPTVGKLAARVARRIETEVVRRGWPVGESLGSEPDLRARYGVSRSVLREAVRLVEHHQVARMRRGPNGGLFVVAPDAGPAARALVIYLEYAGTSVADLMQARRLLEPLAARLAAERLTEDGIALLRRTVDAETVDEVPLEAAVEQLHLVLGELSANPVLQLFVDVLIRLTERFSEPSGATERAYRRAREAALRFHAEIADAVIAGDGGRAEARLGEYLDGVAAWMRSHHRTRASGAPRPVAAGVPGDQPRAKLAEVVAGRLRDDIAAAGWPVGEVVGSETDLLTRYGISRAVLREAVRLLEYHSVARMRRGPGGGLVVTTPEPQAIVETMALYLAHMRVSGADLVAVRDAIELGVLTRVTARHDDPDVAAELEAALDWEGSGDPDGQDRADHFHQVMSELGGNPVLALFLRILTELWRRHSETGRRPVPEESLAEVQWVHRRIADAVIAGDEGLARHRMRRHLTALTEWWH
ncbi:FadR/GntR family transcriptional regulator [Blastococcus sp. SYSU DS0539]